MTFDYFLETSKLVVKYTDQQTKKGLVEHAAKRRAAIAKDDEDGYQKLILDCANWEQLTNNII